MRANRWLGRTSLGTRNTVGVLGAALGMTMFAADPAQAQRYFGQNQVEYRHFRWRVLETEHFLVHYYPEEELAAHDAARMAERSYTRLSRILGHQFREKKPILLFASQQDFSQNNVTGDLGEGTGGVTDASRQRMILPFTGDYASFEHVLTHEMVHQFQYDVFARGKAGENLGTLEAVNPPLWFMEGMAEYLSLGPNHVLTTTWVRDAVENGNLPTIKQMTDRPDKYFPYRYGEALWRYVGERWGDAAIGEILQSSTTVGIERAFQRELGTSLTQLSDQWREATRQQYLPQLANMQRVRDFAQPLLNPKNTGGNIFLAPVLSPDGKTIAFLANGSEKRGEVFIDLWLGDAVTGKHIRRLVKSTTNPSFEQLRLLYSQGSFSPDSRDFAFTAQTGGRDVLSVADVRTGDVKQFKDLPVDGVLSPTYSPDGKHIIFCGFVNALTDLYMMDVDGQNLHRLTHDKFADLQPSYSPDGKWVAFATDRATTKLDNLTTGKLQIALMNLESNEITVLPNQSGLNINPVWSPDGHDIAYISDRDGTPNIYMYNVASSQTSRVTNVQGGVSAITEYSPAISWSRATDRLAFTYYDNNDYTVWSLTNPRAFAKPISTTVAAATTPSTPSTGAPTTGAPTAGTPATPGAPVRDSTPPVTPQEQSSTYRAPLGTRPSGRLSPADVRGDSNAVSSVATMLADPNTGLPDTVMFKNYPYSVHFTPDYVSGGSVGVAGGSYGTAFGGATTVVLSDLTGDHQLAVGAGVYGKLKDASLLVGYADLGHRLQYSTSASRDVAYINTNAFYIDSTNKPHSNWALRETYEYTRYVLNTAGASAEYPLNRFTRFELGGQLNSIGRSVVDENYDLYDDGFVDYNEQTVQTLSTLVYVSPLAALVSDNTLYGLTGPIDGHRYRFSASPAFGKIKWTEYLADYRRYDPILFNTLTFSTRIFADATIGRDENLFPKYIGTPDFVRGYDDASFYSGYTCGNFLNTSDINSQACSTTALIGTRVAVFNEELRFPLIRRFDLGSLPIGLPPLDGLFFYDAGVAWNRGQTVTLKKPENYDQSLQRYVLRSYGFGLRLNLFNYAILRWDLARPLDRDTDKKFKWTFSLGPSF